MKNKLALLIMMMLALGAMSSAVRGDTGPILEGSAEGLFLVQPDDCPGCTTTQIAQLQEGLSKAFGSYNDYTVNPDRSLCIAKASLLRDMVVMIYREARKPGHISQSRFKSFADHRGRSAGNLADVTRQAYRRRAVDVFGPWFGTELAERVGLALYSQIFDFIGQGEWSEEIWLSELTSSITNGPQASALTGQISAANAAQTAIISSAPLDIWLEHELGSLTGSLKDDFKVGNAENLAADLNSLWLSAILNNGWKTGVNGCGIEASWALHFASAGGAPTATYTSSNTPPTGNGGGTGGGSDDDENEGPACCDGGTIDVEDSYPNPGGTDIGGDPLGGYGQGGRDPGPNGAGNGNNGNRDPRDRQERRRDAAYEVLRAQLIAAGATAAIVEIAVGYMRAAEVSAVGSKLNYEAFNGMWNVLRQLGLSMGLLVETVKGAQIAIKAGGFWTHFESAFIYGGRAIRFAGGPYGLVITLVITAGTVDSPARDRGPGYRKNPFDP